MRCTVLGSGSTANSYLFQTPSCTFAVDNGFSLKEFDRRSGLAGSGIEDIDFILVTHDHGDHLRGVGRLSQRARAPVYASPKASLEIKGGSRVFERRDLSSGESIEIGDVVIRPFELNHDAEGAQSYVISTANLTVAIITDTGSVDEEITEAAMSCDLLFLEANYCEDMLADGPYPIFLKRRIASDTGHLSNAAALSFLNTLSESRVRQVFFCHLSDVNNHPSVLEQEVRSRLDWPVEWTICRKNEYLAANWRI